MHQFFLDTERTHADWKVMDPADRANAATEWLAETGTPNPGDVEVYCGLLDTLADEAGLEDE